MAISNLACMHGKAASTHQSSTWVTSIVAWNVSLRDAGFL
jgi:hypothetical protein